MKSKAFCVQGENTWTGAVSFWIVRLGIGLQLCAHTHVCGFRGRACCANTLSNVNYRMVDALLYSLLGLFICGDV